MLCEQEQGLQQSRGQHDHALAEVGEFMSVLRNIFTSCLLDESELSSVIQ
jgi:hypothetical protein